MNYCPLCGGEGIPFWRLKYFECANCQGIFLHPDFYPDPIAEKSRYDHHDSDVYNQGYRNFVNPVVESVLRNYTPESSGLDFGSGNGPVVSVMLEENGYQIAQYDPFYTPDLSVLNCTYDFIVCCEVMEHFHNPAKEFRLLFGLLKSGGRLICMTHIYTPDIDFNLWYYKNDKTHVFFYTPQCLKYIRTAFGFMNVEIRERLILFQKPV